MVLEVTTISNSTITTCNKYNCSTSWDEGYDKHELTHIYFGLGIVTQFLIACVGLIGNALSILIFTTRELRSTFHMLLVSLAFFLLVLAGTVVRHQRSIVAAHNQRASVALSHRDGVIKTCQHI